MPVDLDITKLKIWETLVSWLHDIQKQFYCGRYGTELYTVVQYPVYESQLSTHEICETINTHCIIISFSFSI